MRREKAKYNVPITGYEHSMLMQFSRHQLVLYSKQQVRVEPNALQQYLTTIELLGVALTPHHYQVGSQFLNWIGFVGCSPNIVLQPIANQAFCYISLPTTLPNFAQCSSKKLGNSDTWVIIGNIYPSEAIPDTALLQGLEAVSASPWSYTYCQGV